MKDGVFVLSDFKDLIHTGTTRSTLLVEDQKATEKATQNKLAYKRVDYTKNSLLNTMQNTETMNK